MGCAVGAQRAESSIAGPQRLGQRRLVERRQRLGRRRRLRWRRWLWRLWGRLGRRGRSVGLMVIQLSEADHDKVSAAIAAAEADTAGEIVAVATPISDA